MSQSASEHAVHFVTPPLRSGRPYENPALPELPNLWSLDHPDTAPIPTRRPAVPYGRATPCFPISNGTANAWPAWPRRWPGGPWKQARPDTQSLWPCPSRRGCCTTSPSPIPCVRRQPCPDRRVMGGRFHWQPQGRPSRLPPCRMALAVARRSRTSGFFRHLCGQAGPPRRNGIARRAL